MNPEPVEFSLCPHCKQHTRHQKVKRRDGPSGKDVFLLGIFAFCLGRKQPDALVCEHCRTLFEVPRKRISGQNYAMIFVILALIAAVAIGAAIYYNN